MDKLISQTDRVVYIKGDKIDRDNWDRCIDNAINGNVCAYSWFLDIMCSGWDGIIAGDYAFVMPVPVSRRFGISYLLQPRFIQQSGIFGNRVPDEETINRFLVALPKEIKVVDYHFNDLNVMPSVLDVEMRTNLLLKTDKPYEELRMAYSQNLIRNLKKSAHFGFHIIKNNESEPLIKMFRTEKGLKLSFLKDENYRQLNRVVHACLDRDKAKVWSVYNRENELCGGIIWLFSHGKAVLYFSAQNKAGRAGGMLAWLIDAFIRENASSEMVLDFEGSVDPGLARFYSSFGSVAQSYPRLKINKLPLLTKLVYSIYRKLKKD